MYGRDLSDRLARVNERASGSSAIVAAVRSVSVFAWELNELSARSCLTAPLLSKLR
jgi:hypothetical protein